MYFVVYSAVAGVSSSLGSLFGKASGLVSNYYQNVLQDFIFHSFSFDIFWKKNRLFVTKKLLLQVYISYGSTVLLIVLMLTFNTIGMNFYAKSLQSSSASLIPTLISSAFNYISSVSLLLFFSCLPEKNTVWYEHLFQAFLGRMIFHEEIGILWWIGTVFIFVGIYLIVTGIQKDKKS